MSGRAGSDYDPFAWFYNRYWGHITSNPPMFEIYDRLILSRLPAGARVLDLCCGTGQLDGKLADMGFEVTGVDASEEQLSFARINAPRCHFIHADVSDLDLPPQYDGAICVFDSLNHLMTRDELERTFRNVKEALMPGGIFAFDLNMEVGLIDRWKGSRSQVDDDSVFVMRFSYDARKRTARADVTLFRLLEDGWERSDTVLLQRAYPLGEVTRALATSGFSGITTYDAGEDLGLEMGEGRTFFVAQVPA